MTDEIRDADERHPIRFLLKFAIFAGLIYAIGRFVAQKKDEYSDLTETQAREKLVEQMSPKVGDETAAEIADQVVPKLKDRGLIKADNATTETDESASDDGDSADQLDEAVDSVVKD